MPRGTNPLQCPGCSEYSSRVINSTLDIRRNVKKRLRICLKCGKLIPTEERIDQRKYDSINRRKSPRTIT